MRNLQTSDFFEARRLLTKIGVRDEIRSVAERAEESKTKKVQIDMGFDLFFSILDKATQKNAEKEIYKFISNIFECDPEEVEKMDPLELLEKLEKVTSFENWANFFKRVAKVMRKR